MARELTPEGGFRIPDAEYYPRLLARVMSMTVRDERGCLVWQGFKRQSRNSRTWYGQYVFRNKTTSVHRLVIALTQREPGYREVVMHRCDNGLCCNPAHLKFGTTQENLKDAAAKGSYRFHKSHYTHCKHGHEFTPENTWVCGRGFRNCRECQRRNQRERWRRNHSPAISGEPT